MLKPKKPHQSEVTMTEMVLPNDTNTLNNLMGGRLLHWMDICAAISAQKHSNRIVVTASVDNVSFTEPIRLGNIVTMRAKVTRAFNSSMEVFLEVWAEDIPAGQRVSTNRAFYTFVAETDEESELYLSALRRRQLRLVLAGRMNAAEATELKALFKV